MKNIELYISELVNNHDCVIIPGLGAFIAQPTSADIHPITHKFTAPGRTLGFNAQIKVNDGLLASEISVRQGVSFQEANTFIEEFVKKIATSLSLYKHYTFTGIGRFFYNLEGKLEFEPDYLVNFSSDSFGLTDFVFKPIDRNTYDMNQNTHRKAKEVASKQHNKGEDAATTKSNTLAKVLFVLMPLVVLIGAAGYVVYNQQEDVSLGGINVFESLGLKNNKVVADTAITEIVAVDSLATSIDSVAVEEVIETPEEIISEAEVMEEVTVPVNEVPASKKVATGSTEAGKYYIIVGSFKNENNADNLHAKLVKVGKNVIKLPIDANGYYKVAVGSYETIDAANNEVASLETDFTGIWIKKY